MRTPGQAARSASANEPPISPQPISANRDEVLQQLAQFESALGALRAALGAGHDDEVARLVDAASAVRTQWTLNRAAPPTDDPA
ncbi:MAG: hypothetical protein ACKOGB_03930 [Betaproteobacteria bacterium]